MDGIIVRPSLAASVRSANGWDDVEYFSRI